MHADEAHIQYQKAIGKLSPWKQDITKYIQHIKYCADHGESFSSFSTTKLLDSTIFAIIVELRKLQYNVEFINNTIYVSWR